MKTPQLRRQSREAAAERISALMDNPEARGALDGVRERIIMELEEIKLDGSVASNRQALELVRQLQTFLAFKRELLRPLVAERAAATRKSPA